MASKQRPRSAVKQKAPKPVVDLGIFIPGMDISDVTNIDDVSDSDVDENVLESELQALLSGTAPTKPSKPKKRVAPAIFDVEKMAAECLKDPEEDDDENDESLLNDPELLKELMDNLDDSPTDQEQNEAMTEEKQEVEESVKPSSKASGKVISLLEERLQLYKDALAAAKACGDSSKARRFGRGLKTVESMLKSARSGNIINEEEIPPVVSIPKAPKVKEPEKLPEPLVPSLITSPSSLEKTNENEAISSGIQVPIENDDYKMLLLRRDQYRNAALQAKKAGDKATALEHFKVSKGVNALIEAMQNGEPVDLSNVPPPPPNNHIATSNAIPSKKEEDQMQSSSSVEAAAFSAVADPEDTAIFSAPPPPSTALEALEQRLEKYVTTKATADAEGNTSKSRRLQRIIKSYEKAIKDYKAGKPVDFEELPAPPGFAPIPVPSQSNVTSTVDDKTTPVNESAEKPKVPSVAPKRPAPQAPQKVPFNNSQEQNTVAKPKLSRTNTSTTDKQLEFLLERQKLFRQAALESKKQGDIQQAKEYLRMSKGFDSMIEATKCGLPIDTSNIPTPPQLQTDFVIVEASDCVPPDELLDTLENDLMHQIEVCTRNKEHFLRLGDVSSASKFEKLALESKKDLSVIRHLQKTGAPAPQFHYERRMFSIVQCNPELSDSELEVVVERGINLPGKPDNLDSYVRLELPVPNDAPQKAKTHTIKNTINPTYQEEFKFEINRKSRAQLRQFKRQALKLEVWSRGFHCLCFSGFLRGDTLLGVASVKLIDLESKCTIHDCFDLMDGRKTCGGKLEVKVKIRDPLLVKQVEEVEEKWLVIGS